MQFVSWSNFPFPLRVLSHGFRDAQPALLGRPPATEWLLPDRGYDADRYRETLKDKGIKPHIQGRKSRGKPVKYDKGRYKRHKLIEIMFGRREDWRCVATRYDRCPKVFLSAVALAVTVIFWLRKSMCLEPGKLGAIKHDCGSSVVRKL